MNIDATALLLKQASEAYYAGEPLMSDDEFDALREQLEKVSPGHPFLANVGAIDSNSVWPEQKHEFVMGSQLKVNDEQSLREWAAKYTTGELLWSDKCDGSSIKITYENGFFKHALTRGDGFTGQNISPNVFIMQGFPKTIKHKGTVHVKAEIMLPISAWREHFPDEKNPRNSAAGTARRKTGNDRCRLLQVYAYDMVIEGESGAFKKKSEVFAALKEAGFQIPNYGTGDIGGIQTIHSHYHTYQRSQLDYEIDGLVIEDNDLENQRQQGAIDNRPRAARAYKFPALKATTTLRRVEWQLGRTGVVSPVGVVDPTDIGGVTVTRVHLCNMDYIRGLDLGIGSNVTLHRANDVIPRITAGLTPGKEIVPPTHCPECDSELVEKAIQKSAIGAMQPFCVNPDCSGRDCKLILHFLTSHDVKGLGSAIIDRLIEAGLLKTPADLYQLGATDLIGLEGVSEKVVAKALNDLKKKTLEVPLQAFIAGLGINGFGRRMAELAMTKYDTLDAMRQATIDGLLGIAGFGDETARWVVDGLAAKAPLIDALLVHIKIKTAAAPIDGPLTGSIFCFTGFRSKEAEARIVELGGKISSSVTKTTTHLVTDDPDSGSSKMTKAKSMGLTILTPDELYACLS